MKKKYKKFIEIFWGLGIGDWGLGIGPNPQSPIPIPQIYLNYYSKNKKEQIKIFI